MALNKKKISNYLGRDLSKKREPDKISKARRSSVMSKIRSKGTKFETDFIEKLRTKTRKKYRLHSGSSPNTTKIQSNIMKNMQ